MSGFRPLIAFVLSALLVLTSGTVAVARSHGAGAMGDSIVICSGYGIVTITVDENGEPTGPVHPCPDCLAGMGLAVLPGGASLPLPVMVAREAIWPVLVHATGRDAPRAAARGPPAAV
jgi:hypothetical protein